MQRLKISTRLLSKDRINYYLDNYLKLLDQDIEWSEKRHQALKRGDLEYAHKIQKEYIDKISSRLQKLTSQALYEINCLLTSKHEE